MVVVETPVFTRRIEELLETDAYRRLQLTLVPRPEQGQIIPGSGGLRKARWALAGRGRRGGLRLIYYWDRSTDTIYMIYAYDKRRQGDLTKPQVADLARLVREELK